VEVTLLVKHEVFFDRVVMSSWKMERNGAIIESVMCDVANNIS
jgi:hypothetical protein